jgi:hypothetical protein
MNCRFERCAADERLAVDVINGRPPRRDLHAPGRPRDDPGEPGDAAG